MLLNRTVLVPTVPTHNIMLGFVILLTYSKRKFVFSSKGICHSSFVTVIVCFFSIFSQTASKRSPIQIFALSLLVL